MDAGAIEPEAEEMAVMVERFLSECEWRGLAWATIAQYRWALEGLAARCPRAPLSVMELLAGLERSGLGLESRRDLLKCVRRFFRWAERRYGVANVCGELDPLPRGRLLPRVLSEGEIGQIMGSALTERDRALVLTVLDCGVRVGEVAGLARDDIGNGWVRVRGKVGERQVPVSAGVERMLGVIGNADHIWVGARGPLTLDGMKGAYRRIFVQAGIGGRKLGAHTLRHTFATFYLRAGGGLRQLQGILGHESITTTMIYVHLAGSDIQNDHALYTPVRTLGLLD